MKKILLATIVGGIIAFIWSAVVHMNPLTMGLGLSTLNEKETAVLSGLQSNNLAPGLYFFPGMDMSKKMSPEEEAAWKAKFKSGPSGLLLLQEKGGEPMDPRQLVVEFLSTLLCALIAATLLACMGGSVTCRATLVTLMGLFGWLALPVSYWNWYHYPFNFILVDLIDQVIGWFLAGLAMAKLVKPLSAGPPTA